jgi:2-dehydro-3-deoxyphosphooctonate aldolase (KDO 8-P synthase)
MKLKEHFLSVSSERDFFNRKIGGKNPFFLIAGPCVIESKDLLANVCEKIKKITDELGILYVFKSSFDKANRTSLNSKRGPGLEEGLKLLEWIKKEFDVLILTDVHENKSSSGCFRR